MRDLIDQSGGEGGTGSGPEPAALWSRAVMAAALLTVAPGALGGVVLRARPGHARDAWLEVLTAVLPDAPAWTRLPAGADAAMLSPGLDLAATLAEGRRVTRPGLLERAAHGVLLVPGVERLEHGVAVQIAQHLDPDRWEDAPLVTVALDEGAEAEEAAPAALSDRLAFGLALDSLPLSAIGEAPLGVGDVEAARARLAATVVTEEAIAALAATAGAFGIQSLRPVIQAVAAARAHAALHGSAIADEDDLAAAVELVLLPRARYLPSPETEEEVPPDQPDDQPPPEEEGQDHSDAAEPEAAPLEDRLLEAAHAALPPALLAALLAQNRQRSSAASGAAGAFAASTRRGRPAGVRPGLPGSGRRLALTETLSAAAPWQPLRRRDGPRSGRVEIRRDDLRIRRFRTPRETLTIFAVDASGSAAIARLAEAKGAIELMLAEAYRRRDAVALVAFRKTGAELLLPPTRALARAKRALAALPGGGGTPIAAGLDAARAVAEGAMRRGQSVSVVLLSDGRANIARDGSPGRAAAQSDAEAAGRALAATGAACLVIDTSAAAARRGAPEARRLADAMTARYLALPGAGAEGIAAAATLAPAAGRRRG
ncbi:MAG: magnesium chelatase subunit D [Pseudomonadota bacterium]